MSLTRIYMNIHKGSLDKAYIHSLVTNKQLNFLFALEWDNAQYVRIFTGFHIYLRSRNIRIYFIFISVRWSVCHNWNAHLSGFNNFFQRDFCKIKVFLLYLHCIQSNKRAKVCTFTVSVFDYHYFKIQW